MSKFLQELKRRNVLRVAALYVLLGWIVLQVADVIFGLIQVPHWAGKLLIVFLLLGFPIVIIFAWAFEITPEGIKRESEVARGESITAATGQKLNSLNFVFAAVAILLIAAQTFVPGFKRPAGDHGSDAPVKSQSIAVLPFADMSVSKDQDYLSDGISEEVLNLLAKIPRITVISRTSSFQFKGKNEDVRAIAQKLGVTHVLEGSVRKAGQRIRITVQLVKAENGAHVWSNTYDRTLDDIFAVEDEIAAKVVKALEVTLLGSAPKASSVPENTQAYSYFLQGHHFTDQRTREASLKALAYLDSALAIDPGYARAWAEKANVIRLQVGRADVPIASGTAASRAAAERALELDPNLPEAHVMMASISHNFDWDWQTTEKHLREAEALDSANYAMLLAKTRLQATLGIFAPTIPVLRRLTQRNPLEADAFINLGLQLMRSDSAEAALATFRKALDLSPSSAGVHTFMSLPLLMQGKAQDALAEVLRESNEAWRMIGLPVVYWAVGRKADSDKAMRELETNLAEGGPFQIAEAHAYRGETDLAFHWLERAFELRDPGMTEILADPLLENIVSDPRYSAMLRKLKLPDPRRNL